ncbi:uncharacterized protein LOC129751763 isoform X2 [Uranotaenia lowii]|uniref:uncharacterized protein LOC129751763 isoform X2 n=1 Tax=Uranotaenia lowii TaxID=190385 RepID=UPI0024793768|nr:uncharacterized protein LOC129751763 isoform X2 [Uranotaenia lowii]
MRRKSTIFPNMASGSNAATVITSNEHYEDHGDQNSLVIRQLKRKHSEESFQGYHYHDPNQSIQKIRKDNHLVQLQSSPPEVQDHEFHGFGQAFHEPQEFHVISASDGNNNQNHAHQEQQQLEYIYEVSSEGNVIPVPHSQLIEHSHEISSSGNGIVLTDISSSTWTSTQELIELDRKAALTIQTDTHNSFPIASADLHHHHHQLQQQTPHHHHQQNHHQQHHHAHHSQHEQNFHVVHQHLQPQYSNNHHIHQHPNSHHSKAQELSIVTSGSCQRIQTITCAAAAHSTPSSSNVLNGAGGSSASGNGAVGNSTRRAPQSGTPETPEDIEDKNLSWLFNFKLEDLPHLSPEAKRKQAPRNSVPVGSASASSSTAGNVSLTPAAAAMGIQSLDHHPVEVAAEHPSLPVLIEEDEMSAVAENVTIENTSTTKVTKKPPFTYTELIEYALEDKGELTVSGIYQWISDHFPFYKSNDDRWKNSVRHNLSINPHFRKGNKAPQGAGHLWTISSRDSEANYLAWEHKRQRLELFFKMEAANNSKNQRDPPPGSPSQEEIAAATASLAQYEPHSPPNGADSAQSGHHHMGGAGQQQHGQPLYANNSSHQFEVIQDYYLADYLNPVSKEEIVQECGLRSATSGGGQRPTSGPDGAATADYYITTIDPIELGINMSSGQDEDQILFEDDFNLNYFGNNIMT